MKRNNWYKRTAAALIVSMVFPAGMPVYAAETRSAAAAAEATPSDVEIPDMEIEEEAVATASEAVMFAEITGDETVFEVSTEEEFKAALEKMKEMQEVEPEFQAVISLQDNITSRHESFGGVLPVTR